MILAAGAIMYAYHNCPNIIIYGNALGYSGNPDIDFDVIMYEADVCRQLAKLERTRTGSAVIESIRDLREKKKMFIKPWEDIAKNARATPTNWAQATRQNEPVIVAADHGVGEMLTDPRTGRAIPGTGTGSHAEIKYTAAKFVHSLPILTWRIRRQALSGRRPPNEDLCRPGDDADEYLLHEMVHGLRYMAGVSHFRPLTGALTFYDNEEEFFAILITNIYMSEKGERLLRRDHYAHAPLGKDLDTSAEFLRHPQHAALIKKLATQQDQLFERIRTVRCRFNPIRRYAKLND